jgi:lipopolysaccharide transport system ATP-binding protein
MKPVLDARSLGKQYQIGSRRAQGTLAEALAQTVRAMFRHRAAPHRTFWALRDVSFQAMPGDVIGVIGRNGAGKSTLLKVLSRITEPTAGAVDLYGNVGSLLEVGTGFHQDLTGRENVYLNGSILGMRRAEIARKFDEIVAFAEVDRFIDTPVKRYSSGMYMRLAFAVAAFLDSEILLIDEVLAVGDSAFQKRCLGKMREVSASGRTVLFVSHNMAAVESLCNRCLYFSNGRLEASGTPRALITRYLAADAAPATAAVDLYSHVGRRSGSETMMRRVTLVDSDAGLTVRMGGRLALQVDYQCERGTIAPVLGLVIKNSYGQAVFGINNRIVPGYRFDTPSEAGSVTCRVRDLPLMPGTYSVDLFLGDAYRDYDTVYDAISFEVVAADVFGTGRLPDGECGSVFWPASWTYLPAPPAATAGARSA